MPLTDEELRSSLAAMPVDVDVDADLATVHARADRRRVRRRAVAVACVVFAVGVAGTGIALLTSSDTEHRPRSVVAEHAPTPSSTPSTTPATTLVPPGVEQLPASAVADFALPSGAGSALAIGGGSLWVGGAGPTGPCHSGCGSVMRVDPATGAVVATITVDKFPRSFAFGFGLLWMEAELPDNTAAIVVAIDPTTNQVVAQTDIPGTVIVGGTGHPRIAVGAGAVWSLYGDQLTKFDPQTAAVVGNVRLDGQYFDGGIVADDTGVWLVGVQILAVDPSTLETREIATVEPGYIQSSTIDGDTIWLTEAHGGGGRDPVIELVRIDTTTGEVTYTGVPTYNVAAGEGRVWFQGFAGLQVSDTHSGYAVEVDPATHQMLRAAAIDLAAITPPLLAVDRSDLWLLHGTQLIRVRA